MSLLSYHRILRLGLANFWRNRWLSLAATLMMTLTLLIISFFTLLNISISSISQSIRSRLDVEVYFFDDSLPDTRIADVGQDLKKRSDVIQVDFITKDKAMENWRKNYELESEVIEQVSQDFNPLPRSLRIKATEPEEIPKIVSFLRKDNYKDAVCQEKKCISYNYEKNRETTDKLLKATQFVKRAGWGIGAAFVLVSILIILNTTRLTIFTRRDEIEIMKLVGASHSFIRYPFVIEALLYGVLATILSLLLIGFGIKFISPYIGGYLSFADLNLLGFFRNNIWQIIGLQLLVSLIVGLFCSVLAIRKYLRT